MRPACTSKRNEKNGDNAFLEFCEQEPCDRTEINWQSVKWTSELPMWHSALCLYLRLLEL